MGFFVHPTLKGKIGKMIANQGITDQREAFKWLRENIVQFGDGRDSNNPHRWIIWITTIYFKPFVLIGANHDEWILQILCDGTTNEPPDEADCLNRFLSPFATYKSTKVMSLYVQIF